MRMKIATLSLIATEERAHEWHTICLSHELKIVYWKEITLIFRNSTHSLASSTSNDERTEKMKLKTSNHVKQNKFKQYMVIHIILTIRMYKETLYLTKRYRNLCLWFTEIHNYTNKHRHTNTQHTHTLNIHAHSNPL